MKTIKCIAVVLTLTFLISCAQIPPLQQANMSYQQGKFNESEAVLKYFVEGKKTMKDPSYPLMLLILADSQFRLGDYQSALRSYDAAIKSMTAELSGGKVALGFLKNEANRPYRGTPHDLAFAHYYKGICYFQVDDYEKARIEFSQSRLADKGEKAGQEDDIAIVHFMEGLCYLRLNDLNEANVAFKKVTELKPSFPYGWLELTYTSDKLGFKDDADFYWDKYATIVPRNQQLSRKNDSSCILLIADLGKGPYKTADFVTGQFANYQKGIYQESGFDISLSATKYGMDYEVDDMYFQAKSEGGFAGEVARKVVSGVAKTAVKNLIPFGSLLVGDSSADIRVWYTLSGEVHIALLPVKKGSNNVLNLDFYSDSKRRGKQSLDHFEQNWYYILPQQHSEMKPVYIKSSYDLHNLNVDHISVSEKIENQNIKDIRRIKKEKK
ncbi:MAG: tetratricopeptide repeat protein [Candidatus Cloacimonetes bacterium]|nr:tetratricopeptide repeat protein [Candidatus Cloacimonadota bacterium]